MKVKLILAVELGHSIQFNSIRFNIKLHANKVNKQTSHWLVIDSRLLMAIIMIDQLNYFHKFSMTSHWDYIEF